MVIDRLISVPHLNQTEIYKRWEKFTQGKPVDSASIFAETYRAWKRCVGYQINPLELCSLECSEEELSQRKTQLSEVLALLQPHIQTIKTAVSTNSDAYLIGVADGEGYILDIWTDKQSRQGARELHCYPGLCFAEQIMGNTGVGSVLATGGPLAVIGAEHFLKAFHSWTCAGSPILDHEGKILAVLVVSVPCGTESPYTFSITVAATKAVEASLRQSQMEKRLAKYRESLGRLMQQREIIFNAMSQGVIILNKEGIVTFFNKAAEKIWNIPSSEVMGRHFSCLRAHHCRRQEPLLLKTLREATAFTNIECKCRNEEHHRHLLVNTSLLRDENNGVDGAIGIYNDVTELRKQEARLREQQKLAVVGQMAAGLAHEIRNPLTSVRGFAQLMSEKVSQENTSFREYMDIMIQEIDQADSFINSFLQLARPKPPEKQRCSLNDLIRSFVKIFESQAFLKGIKLETHLQGVPTIVVDQDQIKQVLLNLCQNALQAMEQGTITLATLFYPEHKEICLSVLDQGPGISPENLEKLGTPFFTTKDQGTGLGLSICYTIVDRHRGRIEVDSKLGEGTRFSIYLPVDEQF